MKALTLTQPWATLVALGAKQIETRSWLTGYRGTLAIYAGAGLGPIGGMKGLESICLRSPFYEALHAAGIVSHGVLRRSALHLGHIVAVAELVECVPTEVLLRARALRRHTAPRDGGWALTDQERAFGSFTPGGYGWLLAGVRPLPEPVPCREYRHLWDVPPDVEAAIADQLGGDLFAPSIAAQAG